MIPMRTVVRDADEEDVGVLVLMLLVVRGQQETEAPSFVLCCSLAMFLLLLWGRTEVPADFRYRPIDKPATSRPPRPLGALVLTLSLSPLESLEISNSCPSPRHHHQTVNVQASKRERVGSHAQSRFGSGGIS